jgi:hypothetical protein
MLRAMAYREQAEKGPPSALSAFVVSAAGEPLALRRRLPGWSPAVWRVLGLVLAAPCVLAALCPLFSTSESPGYLWLFTVAALLWSAPLDRFFLSYERKTGFHPVRESVRVRPVIGRGPLGHEVLVDGRLVGAAGDTGVRILHFFYPRREPGLLGDYFEVCLFAGHQLYSVFGLKKKEAQDLAEWLSLGLGQEREKVRAAPGGRSPSSFDGVAMAAAMLSEGLGLAGVLVVDLMAEKHAVPSGHAIYAAIGVAALLARASVVLLLLARSAKTQAELFRRLHAEPARKPGWAARNGRAVFGMFHAALGLVVVGSIVLAVAN